MSIKSAILLESQYLAPIQYFSKFIGYKNIYLEKCEHYIKGTYRNRCHIAGVNGILRLSIPLKKGKNEQQSIREVQISNDTHWQSHHWHSIRSAYGNAPYFEFYGDTLQPFFKKKYTYLYDFNLELLQTINQLIGIHTPIIETTEYQTIAGYDVRDARNAIHPKPRYHQADPHFQNQKYAQVFEEKTGFLPNLSILDLLFCTGPQAILILEECFVNP